MILLNILEEGKKYAEQVRLLYEESFPEEEKKPFSLLEAYAAQGKAEILAAEEEGFTGLVINLISEDVALLDYFAIAPDKRSSGCGGKVIRGLLDRFAGRKYIFEIEMQDETAPNAEDRKRRKAFYLRNGLKETGTFAHAYDTDFELLTPDGELTYEEYVEALKKLMGKDIYLASPSPVLGKRIHGN